MEREPAPSSSQRHLKARATLGKSELTVAERTLDNRHWREAGAMTFHELATLEIIALLQPQPLHPPQKETVTTLPGAIPAGTEKLNVRPSSA